MAQVIYEDDDFCITCSETHFKKFVIFMNAAAGLGIVTVKGFWKSPNKVPSIPNGIYTPFGITEINFLCKNANWYQRKSVTNCINTIKNIIQGYEKDTIIYGSSMGGFGAIHIGAELEVTSVAFSPQATLSDELYMDPPWRRALEYAKFINGDFRSNIVNGKCKNSKIYLFYDGRHILDIKHALYIIKNCNNCISFNIPYSGHACTGTINNIYRIKNIVMEILNNKFNPELFRKDFFNKYNIEDNKKINAFDFFFYICNIIKKKDIELLLHVRNRKTYRDLCVAVLHLVEIYYNKYIYDVIKCICDDKKILTNAYMYNSRLTLKNQEKILDNKYERILACIIFLFNRKKYREAEILCRELYEIDKHNVEITLYLIRILHKLNCEEEAEKISRYYISLNGWNPDISGYTGIQKVNQKKYSEARKFLAPAIRERKNVWYYIYYARSMKEEGDIEKAITFLQKYLTDFYDNADYIAHLGAYLVKINRNKEGKELLIKAKSMKNYPLWVDKWIETADK